MPVPATSLPDFVISGSGSVLLVTPTTKEADAHLRENVQEDAQWWAGGVAVGPRYLAGLIEGLESAGFSIRGV